MITFALYERMIEDGIGGLVRNKDFFWEEVPLQHDGNPASGVWLVTRAGSITGSTKGLNLRTTVDFYIATKNKLKTEALHQSIRQYLTKNICFCNLAGEFKGVSYEFVNVRVRPTTTPQNDGATQNGLIVKVASAELVYDDKSI